MKGGGDSVTETQPDRISNSLQTQTPRSVWADCYFQPSFREKGKPSFKNECAG